jgi:hypothetical protein
MKTYLLLAILILLVVACAPTATPTPDAKATETQIAANIFATQTASAPTATNTPTDTPLPTDTPTLTSSPTDTPTSAPTNTPLPTDTPRPTFTPKPTRPLPTATSSFTRVPKGTPAIIDNGKWQLTYVGEFRDKTIFFYDEGRTAMGVYVTVEFRAKNLQTGTDSMPPAIQLGAIPSINGTAQEPVDVSVEATVNARWEYCGCSLFWDDIDPGQEAVVVATFDVPEATTKLGLVLIVNREPDSHVWSVENVDQIPAFKPKK